MKRLLYSELLELGFGSKIRIVWNNSPHHDKNEEYHGVVFGKKIGWEDGLADDLNTIAECMYNNWCIVYLISE